MKTIGNTYIRKLISKCKKELKKSKITYDRVRLIKLISKYKKAIKLPNSSLEKKQLIALLERSIMPVENITTLPGAPGTITIKEKENLPTIGKLKMVIEKNYKKELEEFSYKTIPSDNDVKRLALKKSFMDYFNELGYSSETIVVDFVGDMTLRRDNQDTDSTDFDFAPNKNKIYSMWMHELERYVRDNKLNKAELDESLDRGTPQGGAFEKQLDRHRQDIMKELWDDFI